ncbi:MAG: hypothetical protein NT145_06535 [Elusimicrobia bacterium]|nr:hypothetical protein [Elusimicrobiota bacterium]
MKNILFTALFLIFAVSANFAEKSPGELVNPKKNPIFKYEEWRQFCSTKLTSTLYVTGLVEGYELRDMLEEKRLIKRYGMIARMTLGEIVELVSEVYEMPKYRNLEARVIIHGIYTSENKVALYTFLNSYIKKQTFKSTDVGNNK